jgi:competence protein ComEC
MITSDIIHTLYLRPVVPLLFSLISGIIACSFFPGFTTYVFILSAICMIFIPICVYKKIKPRLPVLFLFACIGYCSMHPHVSPEMPSNHITRFMNSGKVNISGRVSGKPVQKGFRTAFYLYPETVEEKGKCHITTGILRITAGGTPPLISDGDNITLKGSIRAIRNFNNPGGFDYKRYMAFKGIHASVYARGSDIKAIERKTEQSITHCIKKFRQRISDLIESTVPGEHKYVLKALLIGEKTDIPKTLRKDFNRAGAAHLLAISGLHIGIVASISFFLLKGFFSRMDFCLWNAWAGKCAAILASIPVILYGALSGMSPSTQRAVIMVIIFLLTFLFEERQDMLNTITVAAFMILLLSPTSLFSISFQLSFTAVFFIVYASSNLLQQYAEDSNAISKLIRKTTLFFFISLFAIMGTLPLVAFYFNQISFAGLFSNFLFIPMIGFIIVPMGLLSIGIFPFHIPTAELGIKVCGFLLKKTVAVITYISGIPFSACKTISPNLFEITCLYILLIALINLKQRPQSSLHKKARIIAITASIFFTIDISYWIHQRFFNPDLKVTVFDVGQGSAAFVEFPGSYRMLIDGGGFSDNTVFDVGEKILAPFLWQNKIRTIDTLVLSHPNCDHLNGLIYIAEHFNVKTIWTNNEPAKSKSYQNFLDVIKACEINMPPFGNIQKSNRISEVRMEILYPPNNFIEKKSVDSWRNSNNNSLVIRLKFGSISVLFPGDIMAESENDLVNMRGADLTSSLLLAPHHGSRTSSTVRFLKAVNPDVVVISSGWKNRYNIPHPVVLERYKKMECNIFRTDRNGAISVRTDGIKLEVKPTLKIEH